MAITLLSPYSLVAACLTQCSMGYCISGCLLLIQQDKILLTFLMQMNLLYVPLYTANLLCKMILVTLDIAARVKHTPHVKLFVLFCFVLLRFGGWVGVGDVTMFSVCKFVI